MNHRTSLDSTTRAATLLAVVLAVLSGGCNDGPLKTGVSNWMPKSTGGPIETRPLPPSERVHSDYQQWLESETTAKVRLYEIALQGETNQLNYTVKVGKGETPLGAAYFTDVTFIYRDATNGQYQLEWGLRGKHRPEFLKLDEHPKKFFVQLIGTPEETSLPRLQIMAIEGVEPWQMLVAEPGRKAQ